VAQLLLSFGGSEEAPPSPGRRARGRGNLRPAPISGGAHGYSSSEELGAGVKQTGAQNLPTFLTLMTAGRRCGSMQRKLALDRIRPLVGFGDPELEDGGPGRNVERAVGEHPDWHHELVPGAKNFVSTSNL
jgi:hypothetical protein